MMPNSRSKEAQAHAEEARAIQQRELEAAGLLERHDNHRQALIRRALLLTPASIFATLLLLYSLSYQAWLPAFIVGICTLAVDIEAIATVRDLGAKPVTTRGQIQRLWKKSRYLFFGRVDYMLVDRMLFEIGPIAATELQVGDRVVIEHWPHTTLVISLGRDRGAQPAN